MGQLYHFLLPVSSLEVCCMITVTVSLGNGNLEDSCKFKKTVDFISLQEKP